jgi:hypothetical protein
MKKGDRVLILRGVSDAQRPAQWYPGSVIAVVHSRYGYDTVDRYDVLRDDGTMVINAHPNSVKPRVTT